MFERRIEHRLALEIAFVVVVVVGMEMEEAGQKRKYQEIQEHFGTISSLFLGQED